MNSFLINFSVNFFFLLFYLHFIQVNVFHRTINQLKNFLNFFNLILVLLLASLPQTKSLHFIQQ